MFRAFCLTLIAGGALAADLEPNAGFAKMALQSMKQVAVKKLETTRQLHSRSRRYTDEPTAAPTRSPTASPTYGSVDDFNDFTYSSKSIFYSTKLGLREKHILYESDVFTLIGNCHGYGKNSNPATVDLLIRNVNDFEILLIADVQADDLYADLDDLDDPVDDSEGADEELYRLYLTPGAERLLTGINFNPRAPGANTGVNAGIFLSDGHFLSSFGESSIVIDAWDGDDDYGGDDVDDVKHTCTMAGFVEIAAPNEYLDVDDDEYFFNGKVKLNKHQGTITHKSHADIQSGNVAEVSEGSSSPSLLSRVLLGTISGIFGALVALFLNRKRIVGAAMKGTVLDTVEENNGVVSF